MGFMTVFQKQNVTHANTFRQALFSQWKPIQRLWEDVLEQTILWYLILESTNVGGYKPSDQKPGLPQKK